MLKQQRVKRNASEKACVTHSMLSPVKNEERERMRLGTGCSAAYFSILKERQGPSLIPYAPLPQLQSYQCAHSTSENEVLQSHPQVRCYRRHTKGT